MCVTQNLSDSSRCPDTSMFECWFLFSKLYFGFLLCMNIFRSYMFYFFIFFFFSSRRRHTRFKCDWSSDVCSSDLPSPFTVERRLVWVADDVNGDGAIEVRKVVARLIGKQDLPYQPIGRGGAAGIDRKSVV